MGVAEIVALIAGFFKFFPEIRKLITVLSKTPEEKLEATRKKVNDIFDEHLNEGRPQW